MTTAAKDNNTEALSLIEIDTIGEILNISMGAAATTMSILLNKKVEITTPNVKLKKSSEFEYKDLEPAVGVEINYVHGLHGINQLIISKKDVKVMVGCLLGEEPIPPDKELDDIHLSALGEIMNQMMGSASTALATFFNKSINISPPEIFDPADVRINRFTDPDELIVTVSFKFVIEGMIDSQFITVLPLDFTKELVAYAMNFDSAENKSDDVVLSDSESSKVIGHKQIPIPEFEEIKEEMKEKKEAMRNEDMKPKTENLEKTPKTEYAPQDQKPVSNFNVQKVQFSSFDENSVESDSPEQANLDLVMGVELNVSVEIGRTKKQVKDILNIVKGTIIELDRQAGEPVDVIVNGQLIAKGDVVVIDDNFGVRITKVLTNKNN